MNIHIEKSTERKIGAVLSYAEFFLKAIIQLSYVPIVLKVLGQSEYGVYQLAASLISYLSLLSFGFGGSYLKFYSNCKGDEKQEQSLNSTYLLIFCFFAIVAGIAGYLLSCNASVLLGDKISSDELELASSLLKILALNLALSFPFSVFSSICLANESFIFMRVNSFLQTIFSPLLVLILLYFGYRSIGLVIASTIVTLAGGIANIIYCIKVLKVKFKLLYLDTKLVKSISSFSFFLFLNSIIDQINWNLDKFMLARIVGAASIAVYSVAAQINTIFVQLSDVIASVYAPKVNRIVADNDNSSERVNTLFVKISRIQIIIVSLLVTGFIVFGKSFIGLWAGKDYGNSYYVALFLIIGGTVPLCESLGVDIQRAYNKHQFRSIVYLFVAISNVALSIPLIFLYGEIGAALGTMITMILGNWIIMNIYYQKKMDLDIHSLITKTKKIWIIIFIMLIMGYIILKCFNPQSWKMLIICILIYTAIYLLLIYRLFLNANEKFFLKRMMEKFCKKN